MSVWVYPGSFDPVTLGHMDIIRRASVLCDKLVVAALHNTSKNSRFTLQERTDMLRTCTQGMPNVQVESFGGLLVDFAHQIGAQALIKGVRNGTDFDLELQLAFLNARIGGDLETVFLPTGAQYAWISSTYAREIATLGGDLRALLPSQIIDFVKANINR